MESLWLRGSYLYCGTRGMVSGAALTFIRNLRKTHMNRYGPKAQKKITKVMHEWKRGDLKSGRGGKRVTSRRQAVAIGISEARKAGGKVPNRTRSS